MAMLCSVRRQVLLLLLLLLLFCLQKKGSGMWKVFSLDANVSEWAYI
jgi:hypothetical protein